MLWRIVLVVTAAAALVAAGSGASAGAKCMPTRADSLGPFYEAGAPFRAKVGTGYVLTGTVRSARTCRPVPRAVVELWMVNTAGEYDDAHRARIRVGSKGTYRFESNRPIGYQGRPPHIHVLVRARGFRVLVTQHYPRAGQTRARFDLVLSRAS